MTEHQTKKRTLTGTVVSDAMQKTRVVVVHRQKKHPKYQRYYQVSTKFKAHDENNEYHTGDVVVMSETRPMSKDKRWVIIGKISDAPVAGSSPLADRAGEPEDDADSSTSNIS
jgi:small subunit ribosomal protein S17